MIRFFIKYTILFLFVILTSCHKDKANATNPYLQEVSFSKEINMSLPAYNSLNFASNPVLITDAGVGIQGIVVMKAGESDYRAYELCCPNQSPNSCSRMTINGVNVKCACEGFEYSLYSSASVNGAQYPLKLYRVERNGSVLRVYN